MFQDITWSKALIFGWIVVMFVSIMPQLSPGMTTVTPISKFEATTTLPNESVVVLALDTNADTSRCQVKAVTVKYNTQGSIKNMDLFRDQMTIHNHTIHVYIPKSVYNHIVSIYQTKWCKVK